MCKRYNNTFYTLENIHHIQDKEILACCYIPSQKPPFHFCCKLATTELKEKMLNKELKEISVNSNFTYTIPITWKGVFKINEQDHIKCWKVRIN